LEGESIPGGIANRVHAPADCVGAGDLSRSADRGKLVAVRIQSGRTMPPAIEVKVPDIGDFKDLPIIDILVKPGDTVGPEDPLVSLESDKATMDVPSPAAGVVREIAVKVGDKVSEGSLILLLEAQAAPAADKSAAPSPAAAAPAAKSAPVPVPSPASLPSPASAAAPASVPAFTGKVDLDCDVLVLGAGPGGYSAAFRAADLGKRVVLSLRAVRLCVIDEVDAILDRPEFEHQLFGLLKGKLKHASSFPDGPWVLSPSVFSPLISANPSLL
jgi:hypothetical protein